MSELRPGERQQGLGVTAEHGAKGGINAQQPAAGIRQTGVPPVLRTSR
jgi:hypothetical protein